MDLVDAGVVDADDDNARVGAGGAEQPILRMDRDVDVTGVEMRVASHLLGVERVHQDREDERDHDRHSGAVGVPVPDVAAQVRRIISAWQSSAASRDGSTSP